jgi:hypothetical protein
MARQNLDGVFRFLTISRFVVAAYEDSEAVLVTLFPRFPGADELSEINPVMMLGFLRATRRLRSRVPHPKHFLGGHKPLLRTKIARVQI